METKLTHEPTTLKTYRGCPNRECPVFGLGGFKGESFCSECGSQFEEFRSALCDCGHAICAFQDFCASCGKAIPPGAGQPIGPLGV